MQITDCEFSATAGAFVLVGATDALANALRVAMSRDVPTPAVARVTVHTNTSSFPDEYVSHRCGLVPIRGPPEGTLAVHSAGPGRVYTSQATSASHEMVEQALVLATLGEGETLHLEMHVEEATGARHARHNPAVGVRFARRHRGVCEPECFCKGTPHGARCAACGLRACPADKAHNEIVHFFQYETTGTYTARELLGAALGALRATMRQIRAGAGSAGAGGRAGAALVAPLRG